MELQLSHAPIYRAVRFARVFPLRLLRAGWLVLLPVGAVSFALSFIVHDIAISPATWLPQALEKLVTRDLTLFVPWSQWVPFSPQMWRALALLTTPIGSALLFLEIFFAAHLQHPPMKKNATLAERLNFQAAQTLARARSNGGQHASASHVLSALFDDALARRMLGRAGLTREELAPALEPSPQKRALIPGAATAKSTGEFSHEVVALVSRADEIRVAHGHTRITVMDLVAALYDILPAFQQALIQRNLDAADFNQLATWYEHNAEAQEHQKKFWRRENLLRATPIGTRWVYGYTQVIQRFALDVSRLFEEKHQGMELINRTKEIAAIEEVLVRGEESNILLIGEPGIGKRSIVLGLVQNIARGTALRRLNYRRVFELNTALLTSSLKDPGQLERVLATLFEESGTVGNVVWFIDDIHNLLARKGVAEILAPYLESSSMHIVATTTREGFHKQIESRADILAVFDRLEVAELPHNHILRVVEQRVDRIEAEIGLFFTYGALKAIVDDADKYVQLAPFPEKAVDLLNEVASHAEASEQRVVTAEHVHAVVSARTNIPLGTVSSQEQQQLLNLESELHKEIVGQDEAVKAVARTLQRLRTGLAREGKPAGVFLFVGPTGVGKTLTAQILAKTYFGSSERMIRFDMSEFQTPDSVSQLLGSAQQNDPGRLASAVRDKPFSVILLDEFEKADHNLLNVFLRVFDEGRMTDAFGRPVSFEQAIIIATSNAGSSYIRKLVKEGKNPAAQAEKERLMDVFIQEGMKPELLNRFDDIIVFHPLSQEQIRAVATLMLKKLSARLEEQGYFFTPSAELTDYVTTVGFDPQFGARPMARAIQDHVEAVISRKILEGTIKKGVGFTLSPEEAKAA